MRVRTILEVIAEESRSGSVLEAHEVRSLCKNERKEYDVRILQQDPAGG